MLKVLDGRPDCVRTKYGDPNLLLPEYGRHDAIDLFGPAGTKIIAPTLMNVLSVNNGGEDKFGEVYGWLEKLKLAVCWAHISTTLVKGGVVMQGQEIGKIAPWRWDSESGSANKDLQARGFHHVHIEARSCQHMPITAGQLMVAFSSLADNCIDPSEYFNLEFPIIEP